MLAAAGTGTRRLPAPRVEPSGKWGPWLHAHRTAAGRTQKQVFDELRRRWPSLFPWLSETSLDSYRAFEKGRADPTSEQEAAFLEFYPGSEPPETQPAADRPMVSVPADVIEAISLLVDELRATRQERASLEERIGALETAAKLRDRPTAEGAGTPQSPRVSAR